MQNINKILRLQKVYIFFISFVLFIIIFSTTYLHANTFKVSDIEISAPFQLDFNKNKVIDNGFRAAFYNLISMITVSEDRDKIENIPLNELKGMIDSFTISKERFISNEYFAELEVTFNKKNTLSLLEKKNIFPSIPIKNKVLLIPVFIDLESDNIYLFTDNIFYEKWNSDIKNYDLLNYILPSEDIEDLNNVQKNFKFIEDYNFTDLIKKYDIKDYIITIIFKNRDEFKVLSKINLNNTLKVNNRIFKNIDLKNHKNFQIILRELKKTYEDHWKKNNEINTSIKLPLTVSINSNEYLKIQNFEKTLNSLDLVSDFYIYKFDNKNTIFKIIYNGSPKIFLNDMKKINLNLIIKDNMWIVQ